MPLYLKQSNVVGTTKFTQTVASVEYAYDNYAPMMFGIITKMTGDDLLSEEILKKVFLELYKKEMLVENHPGLCRKLLIETFQRTLKHLETIGLTEYKPFNDNYPLINLFYFNQKDLKQAATERDMTEQEVLKSLRLEFNHCSSHI